MEIDIVDFHAHVLPCADHGSNSVTTSLIQLEYAKAHGVKRIIATPHFYPHRHTLEFFLNRRRMAYEALIQDLPSDAPEIKLGAEVLLCEGLGNFEGIEQLCISGTKTLLLELPFTEFRNEYADAAAELLRRGFDIVLAHVDRYPKDSIERMRDVGVSKFQINASSLAKLFKKKHLFDWIYEGLVVALGSDIHNKDKGAYRKFRKAVKALGVNAEHISQKSDKIWN